MSPEHNSRDDWKTDSDTSRAGRTVGVGDRRAEGLGAHIGRHSTTRTPCINAGQKPHDPMRIFKVTQKLWDIPLRLIERALED